MKLLYKREDYIRYSLKVARKSLKRRLKNARRIKHERRQLIGFRRSAVKELNSRKGKIVEKAPKEFLILQNQEEFSGFVNRINLAYRSNKSIYIDLDEVENIDDRAITVLLSVMYLFKSKGIKFNGSFPLNPLAKELVVESGFLSFLFERHHQKTNYNIGEHWIILTQEDKILDPQLVANLIREISIKIWGSPMRCPELNKVIQELIDNTKQHASGDPDDQKRWWLCVRYDEQSNKVSFTFTDYGIGVFSSLGLKPKNSVWYKKFVSLQQTLGANNNAEHLKHLISSPTRETSTGKKGRGLGLYGINQIMKRNGISNLYVITNNAFGDISNDNYSQINTGFNGTLICWEMCYNNTHIKA